MMLILNFCSHYLIEVMSVFFLIAIGFRWASYKSSRVEEIFFTTFTSEVEKVLMMQKEKGEQVHDVEKYIHNLLDQVKDKLPTRTVRHKTKKRNKERARTLGAQSVVSLKDYVTGDQSLFLGIKSEVGSFKSKYPPNFNELTDRILEHDEKWNKLLNIFPIGPISRLIDIMPGIFVVLGIFGTFIGIAMALPEIANMDFSNLESSGSILTRFVNNVTFSMNTSIAGIIFSLLMTFLNTIAPVSGLRHKIYKKVGNSFENIWHSIHGEATLEQELKSTLPKLLQEVKMLREKFVTADDKKESA